MTKRALVILAEGAEEMEAVIAIDVLRRADVEVIVAGLDEPSQLSGGVVCSRKVKIVPDMTLDKAAAHQPYDLVVLPGGLGGSDNLAASNKVKEVLQMQESAGRLIGAICAAPLALKSHGIGLGKSLTSYPAVKEKMEEGGKYKYTQKRVNIDGNLITSRGPGTAFEFALALVELLQGADKKKELMSAMLIDA